MAYLTINLPLELRARIYEYLLVGYRPDQQALRLYHDRKGRSQPIGLSPAILRVSKATYAEASPVLYKAAANRFKINLSTRVVNQCTGGCYPDSYGKVENLLIKTGDKRNEEKVDTLAAERWWPRQGGVILPESLRRIRYLQLNISYDALWGQFYGGRYFSHIGTEVLPDLLRVLAEDDGDDGEKREKMETNGRAEEKHDKTRKDDHKKMGMENERNGIRKNVGRIRKTLKVISFDDQYSQINLLEPDKWHPPINLLEPDSWRSPATRFISAAEEQEEEDKRMVEIFSLLERVSTVRDLSFQLVGQPPPSSSSTSVSLTVPLLTFLSKYKENCC